MNNKIIFSILILSCFSIFLISCDNNMVNTNTVSGKIFLGENFPAANMKVSIGESETRTAADGGFQLSNISFPYNITVLDTTQRIVSVFKDLSTDKVNLDMGYQHILFYYGHIFISLPDSLINDDLHGKLIFTDGEYVNSYADIQKSSVTTLPIALNEYKPVTGKIILLTYKYNSSGNIVSYENYGIINNFTVNPGQYNHYTFSPEEIAFNPGEETIPVTVNNPLNYLEYASAFILSFTDKKISVISSINSFGGAQGSSFQLTIPTGISETFSSLVYKEYFLSNNYTSELYPVYTGYQNNLEIKLPPTLISPENFATNVNNATLFSFSESSGNGVYEISIQQYNISYQYRILTSSTSFRLSELDPLGLGSLSNQSFNWSVSKIGLYDSMNDYASNRLESTEWFNSRSSERNFSTQP